jgi:NAD(P)-dependent dehydrogenase (short-subunit alcohol dehydrogenase family)
LDNTNWSTALDAFGQLDVFVGNAGLWDFNRPLLGSSIEDTARGFDELFAVNVKGYLLGARAAAEALRETRGSMIFTLSNASFFPAGGVRSTQPPSTQGWDWSASSPTSWLRTYASTA